MNDTVFLAINEAEQGGDIARLADIARTMVNCAGYTPGAGYVVVDDDNPGTIMFWGGRSECCAFVEGYDRHSIFGDYGTRCVCVDCPELLIVSPSSRVGERLR